MLLRALYDFSSSFSVFVLPFWCHGVWFAPIMILPNETDQCVVLIGRESQKKLGNIGATGPFQAQGRTDKKQKYHVSVFCNLPGSLKIA